MSSKIIYLRGMHVVWGKKNYDRLVKRFSLDSGDDEIFLSNFAEDRQPLDMRLVSPLLRVELEKSFIQSDAFNGVVLTTYWGAFLPDRAASIQKVLEKLPAEAKNLKGDLSPNKPFLSKLYMEHENGSLMLNGTGLRVKSQSSKAMNDGFANLAIPVINALRAQEMEVVPKLKQNPLVSLEAIVEAQFNKEPDTELPCILPKPELDIIEQAIRTSNRPLDYARLVVDKISNISDELAASLFLTYRDRDILKSISVNPNIMFTKPLMEQILHTSRRPLLDFQIPNSWIVVATVVHIANNILAISDLKLAERFVHWKFVVQSENDHIGKCRDNLIDLIADIKEREEL